MNHDPKSKWSNPITISTIVIAMTTIVNTVRAILMWSTAREYTQITRDIFRFTNRPYLGVVSVSANRDEANRKMSVTIELKNTGTVSARDVEATGTLSVNGKSVSVPEVGGREFA